LRGFVQKVQYVQWVQKVGSTFHLLASLFYKKKSCQKKVQWVQCVQWVQKVGRKSQSENERESEYWVLTFFFIHILFLALIKKIATRVKKI
jgi:hypothetical protein